MNSDFKELLQIFNANNVDYLIVGGYAVIEYTEPRYTKDLDIWVRAEAENAQRVFRALAQFGAPLESMTAADFAEEGFVFQIGVAPVRIDILMSVSFAQSARPAGLKICLISPVLKPLYHPATHKNSRPVHHA